MGQVSSVTQSCPTLCDPINRSMSGFPVHHQLPEFTQTYLNSEMSSVQFTQSCLTLCNPMDCRISGFPVHYQLPEPTQTHVHHVGDAIQPSHPLSSPSPPALNLSQHQGFRGCLITFKVRMIKQVIGIEVLGA